MSLVTSSNALAIKLQSRDSTREPTWVRYTLLTIALIFFKLSDPAINFGLCRSFPTRDQCLF